MMRIKTMIAGVIVAATTITGMSGCQTVTVEREPLICGAYTQANAEMNGCELLPGYTIVPGEPQEDDPWWDCRIHGDRIC